MYTTWQLSPGLSDVRGLVYKLFTGVILNRTSRTLDEGQTCEQAEFRKGFSTIDHIHTITKLIDVSLCLTFINLKKVFDSVETEEKTNTTWISPLYKVTLLSK
ncbi:unnamed protein product [Heligmosomoides polygyrus]|uniref:Reverse transcriptase domain-containing protein n=1 Tax=Heligmosomoides polygyrus TaxID=6339 RepID=A0A183F9T9_HELPZ|nr:unnamed protein product [Heligmosomoides polygyrus]